MGYSKTMLEWCFLQIKTDEFDLNLFYIVKIIRKFVIFKDNKMPTVKIIDNIKVELYSRDHPPPHIHVKYAEYEELIVIETLKTFAGRIPSAQRKKVTDWAEKNQPYLLTIFNTLNPTRL